LYMRVVLVEPEYEGNIGSIARLMKNFEFNELWLVRPKAKLGKIARAYAMHAQEILASAHVVDDIPKALKGVGYVVGTTAVSAKRPSNLKRTSVTPFEFAKIVASTSRRVALLFGSESTGLSNRILGSCDLTVTIPASSNYRTLNVANAAAIVFYELFRARRSAERTFMEEASKQDKDRITRFFKNLSKETRIPFYKQVLCEKAFRNIIARTLVSRREAYLMSGVLRKATDEIKRSRKQVRNLA